MIKNAGLWMKNVGNKKGLKFVTIAKKIFYTIFALSIVLTGCASRSPQPEKLAVKPMSFEAAARALTRNLLAQLRANQQSQSSISDVTMAVEPMIDANTAEVTKASRQIENIILDETHAQFPKIKLLPLNPVSVETAKYMLTGMIKLESKGGSNGAALYRIGYSIIDLKSNLVMASAETQVVDSAMDITPVDSSHDAPMYTNDKRTDGRLKTVKTAPGELADKDYMDGLTTAALLDEGDRFYDSNNYEKALSYYKTASLRPDGQVMRTYSTLYQAYRKINKNDEAEVAFGRLISLGYSSNNMNIKLMFSVAGTQFIADPDLRAQYTVWLRQLAKLFAKNDGCTSIIGHSSRSGSETFNESLSMQRAQYVQKLMQKDFPKIMDRSIAIGRGWKENIVGIGSDDMRDAIDRRVEFKMSSCR